MKEPVLRIIATDLRCLVRVELLMADKTPELQGPVCPLPQKHTSKIVLGHGSGGKMMAELIRNVF